MSVRNYPDMNHNSTTEDHNEPFAVLNRHCDYGAQPAISSQVKQAFTRRSPGKGTAEGATVARLQHRSARFVNHIAIPIWLTGRSWNSGK